MGLLSKVDILIMPQKQLPQNPARMLLKESHVHANTHTLTPEHGELITSCWSLSGDSYPSLREEIFCRQSVRTRDE